MKAQGPYKDETACMKALCHCLVHSSYSRGPLLRRDPAEGKPNLRPPWILWPFVLFALPVALLPSMWEQIKS